MSELRGQERQIKMNLSTLNETDVMTTQKARNSSFENHMSLYASHNVQEAAQRARLFEHVGESELDREQGMSQGLGFAALAVMISSLLAFLLDRFLAYTY